MLVNNRMSQVGATRLYRDLGARVARIPFVESCGADPDQYVTDKALEGLFIMPAEEERKIREEPAAQVTDLLKEVFGGAE